MKLFNKFIVYLILLSPVLISFHWHYINTQIPASDAVDWLTTAIDINNNFYNGEYNNFIKEFLTDRPWRPIIFHLFISPVLLLTNGNILIATSLIHSFFTGLSVFFLFKIFGLFSSSVLAALGASIICISVDILFGGVHRILFAEIALFPFLLGTIYFLLKSGYFRNKKYSYLFSLFFFMAIALRPIEAIVHMILPLAFILMKAVKKNIYTAEQLLNVLRIPFSAVSILLLTRVLNKNSKIYFIDPPNSGDIFLYTTILSIFFTVLIFFIHSIVKYKNRYISKDINANYLKVSFVIFTVLTFIWWVPYFSNLYEWVYRTSVGDIVSYYKPNTTSIFSIIHTTLIGYGIYTFIIISMLAILSYLFSLIKRNNNSIEIKTRELLENINFLLLLCVPIPLLLYFFSVQTTYRKISFVMIAITIILILYSIRNKIKFFTIPILSLVFLIKIGVTTSVANINYINERWWDNSNTKSIYLKFIGTHYPIPINIDPNPHDIVLDFFTDVNNKKKLGHIGLVFNESGDPVDAFVLQLMCKKNNLTCSLVYTTSLEFLDGDIEKYKDRYDIFYFINPPEVNMEISKKASKKLKSMMEYKYYGPSARLSYYIQYLYSSNKLSAHNMNIDVCHKISEKFMGCLISLK